MDNTETDILSKYKNMTPTGKEPIRLLKDISGIDAWSNIPDYMVTLMVQVDLLNDLCFKEDNFLTEKLTNRLRRNYLSKGGYAREQFRTAHNGLIDQMRPILAGTLPDQDQQLKRNQ